MVNYETSDIAHKMRREFEQLPPRVNDKEKNSRILKGLPYGLSVKRGTLSMLTGVRSDDLGEALARFEEDQEEKDTGGTHTLTANLRSQGGGQRGHGGGARGDNGSRGGHSKRGESHYQQHQRAQQRQQQQYQQQE